MNDQTPPRKESRTATARERGQAAQTFAAVDLGSNSFHLIVARQEHGVLHIVDRHKEMVRLADGLDARGHLSFDARSRAVRCLARFGQRLRYLPRPNVRAVGTNTLRRANNARAFLIAAETALGHPVEIISGFEEARMIYRGVAYGMPPETGARIVLDIGGGSTEFVRGSGDEVQHLESVGLGCVGLSRRWFPDGKIDARRWREAHDDVCVELQGLRGLLAESGSEEFVGSSGTIRAAATVAQASGWCARDLTRDALDRVFAAVLAAGHVEKLDLPGLSARRRPVFAGGMVMLSACFEVMGIENMRISRYALREGVLLDLLGRASDHDQRETTIRALMKRYGVDLEQALRVDRTAARLFKQAADGLELDARHALWLHWASMVHEIGLAISHSRYHEHGAYLLRHSDLAGFSRQDQAVLAALLRSHRRKLVRADFDALPEREQGKAVALACLLRLAVLFNRARADEDHAEIQLAADDSRLRLALPGGWLSAHPLTRVDLELETRLLRQAGIELALD